MRHLSILTVLLACLLGCSRLSAQELNATVTFNTQQIQGTDKRIFETLKNSITQMLNDRSWTNQQYLQKERINCSFNITVTKYDAATNHFNCTLLLQSTRPVYNSTYTTTGFSLKDGNFDFTYQEYDQLEFREDQIDNPLTALLGYYANLIIGMDMDTMSELGGTTVLQSVMNITNSAQSMNEKGWKAFDDKKNRFGIINDYLDGGMESYRKLQYTYYRKGLDEMAANSELGRASIIEALRLLQKSHEAKPMSYLPQLFTDYKRDELVSIFSDKGTAKEREDIYNILSTINASQNAYWSKMTK